MIRRWQRVTGLRGGLIALGLLVGWTAVGLAQSRERLGYWRAQYPELTRTADPRADKAHSIFQRLVQVAGTRPGKVPRLFIAAPPAIPGISRSLLPSRMAGSFCPRGCWISVIEIRRRAMTVWHLC